MEDKSIAQKPGPEKGNARIDFKPESQSTDAQGVSVLDTGFGPGRRKICNSTDELTSNKESST